MFENHSCGPTVHHFTGCSTAVPVGDWGHRHPHPILRMPKSTDAEVLLEHGGDQSPLYLHEEPVDAQGHHVTRTVVQLFSMFSFWSVEKDLLQDIWFQETLPCLKLNDSKWENTILCLLLCWLPCPWPIFLAYCTHVSLKSFSEQRTFYWKVFLWIQNVGLSRKYQH